MTAPPRPEPDERDPALDAAWRAWSVETPPPALDAAILAAAHREARSRPRPAGDDDDTLAEAREPSRWWWGLAAAATNRAIAFGVVQLAPTDAPGDATVATDIPAQASRQASEARPASEPRVPSSPPNEISTPDPLPPPTEPKREEVAAPAPAPEPERKRDTPPPAGNAVKSTAKARAATGGDVPADRASRGAPQPFPSTALTPSVEPQRERALTPESIVAAPRAAAPAPAGAVGAAAPAVVVEPPSAGAARGEHASAPRALAQKHADVASADAFVTRIRELVDAGRLDEAVRELQAFRAAYADADARLPEPLKAWAASVPRK
jgi:hypothetical protein